MSFGSCSVCQALLEILGSIALQKKDEEVLGLIGLTLGVGRQTVKKELCGRSDGNKCSGGG